VPRPRRDQEPGAFYHVVSRGNNKQIVFDDHLRRLFLERLERVATRRSWRIFGWALMTNHYHLVLQIQKAELAAGMCELNTWFAHASNATFGRIDHCLGRRYWSARLETQHRLLLSVRYGMWNPPRANVCDDPAGSRWTSFRASVGLDPAPPVLARTQLLELFHPDPGAASRVFSDFVSEGRVRCQAPWDGPASH
jgi:REP element-mobilizing transposase RayT